ncbi:sporulation initiation factor Spo0A C-terminal domain-containing protein [Hominifimenecus sp. rT4P-3]|uniref:sporulation initiation factor Spo0A C-terminal domain-containing protein n=1 Tax=Hominifimenecus sp. rT4P-3 TaxID=3242979 RepID=UPI003DA25149
MKQKEIYRLVVGISGRPASVGYRQLTRAIVSVVQKKEFPIRCLTSVLYPEIAKETGSTPQNVARNIARAVEDCWEHGNRKELERIAGRRLTEKPSPGELILYFYNYCLENESVEK